MSLKPSIHPSNSGSRALTLSGTYLLYKWSSICVVLTCSVYGLLAKKGINSLRMEKRSMRYAADFQATDGLNEEYYEDYTKAYEWLVQKVGKEKVYRSFQGSYKVSCILLGIMFVVLGNFMTHASVTY